MKVLSSIFFFFIALEYVYCGHPTEEKKQIEECERELGISANSRGPAGNCFAACMMEKIGMMEDGKLSLEGLINYFSKDFSNITEDQKEILENCIEESENRLIIDQFRPEQTLIQHVPIIVYAQCNKENDKCKIAASIVACFNKRPDSEEED